MPAAGQQLPANDSARDLELRAPRVLQERQPSTNEGQSSNLVVKELSENESGTHLDLMFAARALLGRQENAGRAVLVLVAVVMLLGMSASQRRSVARVGAVERSAARDGREDDSPLAVTDEFFVRGLETGRARA